MLLRRRLRWFLGFPALMLLIAALVLYTQAIAIPPGYVDPNTVPRVVLDGRSQEFGAGVNRLMSQLASNRPFNETFTDTAVNASIVTTLEQTGAAWYDYWRIPTDLEDIQVQFQPGRVTCYGRLERGALRCILSTDLEVRPNAAGDLDATVTAVRVGRVRVPHLFLGRYRRALTDRPLTLRIGAGRHMRLQAVYFDAGAIRLIGGPMRNAE